MPSNREQVRYSFAPLVKALAPSVVNVYAARQVQQRSSPFAGDPFFERFFGRDTFGGRPRQRISRSLGSGVVVGENGLVITNHHVIKNADEVKVSLSDGREYAAEILLIDKQSDLAVLKINPDERLPAVILGDSENLEVGDLVLAIGNPFGVGQTVTSGIISALARSQRGIKDFGFFIQTDASINPGNSGGALVGMNGELIGINTAIFSRSGGSNGIGFAVPSNMVRVVLDSARKGSKSLLRPWVGAQFQAVSADIAESLGMQRPTGALVSGVTAGGPAQRAGLKLGDVILSLDGKPIPHVAGLGYRLATAGIGRQVSLTVLTRNQRRVLKISLSQAPEVPARDIQKIGGRSPFSGIVAANLSPRVAQELGMSTEKTGVVIMSVGGRSLAARFGFRAKDILVEINDDTVLNTRILVAISKSRERGWAFTIERNGVRRKQFIR
ncbi:MAG: DegQ family serine endoprotease [Rhizobiaceae bacterium]